MPKTRLISPGSIPNHKLLKNLQLQDNYISNDGGDEGIRIANDGDVSVGSSSDSLALLDVHYTAIGTSSGSAQFLQIGHAAGSAVIRTNTSNYKPLSISSETQQLALKGTPLRFDSGSGVTNFLYNGDTNNYCSLTVAAEGATTIATTDADASLAHLTLDAKGSVNLDAVGGINFKESGITFAKLNFGCTFQLFNSADADDLFKIVVASAGATKFSTVDDSGANAGHLTFDMDGNVGIATPTTITPATKLEVFNSNVQYSTGTAYQTSTAVVGSGTTFTSAMVGGRFVFDDGTDAGYIVAFASSTALVVESSQTVSSGNYKIYYPTVQIDTEVNSTSINIGDMSIDRNGMSRLNSDIEFKDSGNIEVDATTDITLSADGGNITMDDGTTTVFDFDVGNVALKIMDDADTGDYFNIAVGANGATTITTVDDNGANADLVFTPDGSTTFGGTATTINTSTYINPPTKTASGTADYSLRILETLNLGSGEAGGSDTHYGIYYNQNQTDIAGWNTVYLMYLSGAGIFSVDKEGNLTCVQVTTRKLNLNFVVGSGNEPFVVDYDYDNTTAASKYGMKIDIDRTGEVSSGTDNTYGLETTVNVTEATGGTILAVGHSIVASGDSGGTSKTIGLLVRAQSADANYAIITTAGNVGFGVDDPDQALEVNGDIHVENTVYFTAETANTIGNGATGTIDWNTSQKQKVTITGTGITCNFTNPAGACNVLLKVVQGDGSDVISTWDSDIKWAGGTAPTLSTGNGEIDILSFYWDGTNYFGVASLDFATP